MASAPLPEPAPGDLHILQALVNTSAGGAGEDAWKSPAALADWLVRQRLLSRGTRLAAEDLERAVVIRRGLRALFWVHSGGQLDTAAVEGLDEALSPALLRPRFQAAGGPFFDPAESGFDEACARLFEIVLAAHGGQGWTRLKVCAAPGCGLVFYDGSKSRTGKWCSMRRCGGRLKAQTYRQRHPYLGSRRR